MLLRKGLHHIVYPLAVLRSRSSTIDNRLLRISRAVFAHTLEDIIMGYLARAKTTLILTRSQILASFRCIESLLGIIPLFDMDDVNHLSQLRILEDGILHILIARQSYPYMLARLGLPFGNGLQPELGEMVRTGFASNSQYSPSISTTTTPSPVTQ